MKQGKFIVIEGTDGAGKGTQLGLLKEKLQSMDVSLQVIDFPRYEDNAYGKLIGEYLNGKLQKYGDINPYLLTLAYAGDRALAGGEMKQWIEQGDFVIANRYLHSNVAYSIAKLPEEVKDNFVSASLKEDLISEEIERFINWNYDLEYGTNGIPKEELVILLYVDPEIAQKNIEQKGERSYMGGKGKDVHEVDVDYQKAVANAYLYLSKTQPHWVVIDCAPEGSMLSPEQIHNQIMEILKDKGIVE